MIRQFAVVGIAIIAVSVGYGAANLGYSIGIKYVVTGYTPNQRFSHASGVFYDAARDEVSVADTGNGQVVVFDKNGMPVGRYPHFVQGSDGKRQQGEPRSVVVKKNGDVLVTDNLCPYIDVLDFQGRSVQKVWPGELLGLPRDQVQARCLAMDAQETVYVSITGAVNGILALGPDLSLKAEIARSTLGTSTLRSITGLWVGKDGVMYVSFAQGQCVRIYGPDGSEKGGFGKHETGPQNFSLPSGVVTDAKNNIWVVDNLRHVVSVFRQGPDGKREYHDMIGGFGGKAGQFAYPSAIGGDGVTRLFVLENTGARLQAFELRFTDENG
ncbi:MAG: NHL repeat-containing protein [Armatimonadota bacterium]